MKSQYPYAPVTYQCSEPLDYLLTFEGIRQISVEKVEIIKAKSRKEKQQADKDQTSTFNKEEDDGLSSFFYAQSFTAWDKE